MDVVVLVVVVLVLDVELVDDELLELVELQGLWALGLPGGPECV